MNPAKFIAIACLILFARTASAQDTQEKEPAAILELGGAASRSLKDGGSSFGPTVAVEVTPIEKWLELEMGVTPTFARNATAWSTDVLFKKPWTLSRKVEFMVGVGPEWIHRRDNGISTNSIGAEAAADFMFWRSAKHRFGFYLEPGFDYDFGRAHEFSVGITGGLLIGIH